MIYALWIVQGLLAALFLFTGGMKLILPLEELTGSMPVPGPFLRFIGVAEVLGALGLILPGLLRIRPGLTPLAAAGLVILMIGATAITLTGGAVAAAPIPLVVGLLAAFVFWGRWRGTPRSPIKRILLGLVALVVVVVGVVALQPSEFRVVRAATMAAPGPTVFAQVNDFHNWQAWSPWAKLDPAMKQAYEGAPAGAGAVYTWAGNREVGEGRMTVTESRPSELIRIKLEFMRPFEATSTAEFTFKPEGDRTAVTWSMRGQKNFTAKAVHLFMDMDKMVGGQFEKGLANLKSITEAAAKK